jgi:two-component system sensor kinase FixL
MVGAESTSNEDSAVFQALITTAVDGIIVIDAGGHIQIFNPACERLFGYRPEEVIGENVKMLMPPPYREEHDGYLTHYHATGEKRIIGIGREVLGQRKDGSTFPMVLSVGQGKMEGADIYVGIIHDLTERQANDRRMREMQAELLHVSRLSAMGQMGSALAHELNQPLAAIMNYVKAAQRTLEPSEDPRALKARDLIVKAGEQIARAGNIIRNLRDFIGKREVNRRDEKLQTIIEEAIALGLVGAADNNVKTKITLDPELPPVFVDKVQIQQVIINLVRNAVEAMQQVTVRRLGIAAGLGAAGMAEVTISDSGPGLPPEVASRLFQPFVSTKEKGMGLGLTICQSIINSHGGRLWATPNEGSGVCFHFQLPLATGSIEKASIEKTGE